MTTPKGERRRTAIINAAASLLLFDGPAALTHRQVAKAADVPLAATTYYFAKLDDLLAAAGAKIATSWAQVAERVADRVEKSGSDDVVEDLLAALLPRRTTQLRGHYEHLVSAGRAPALAAAYREGRGRIDEAVQRILTASDVSARADLVVAIIDGAAVSALNEGRSVRDESRRLLVEFLGSRA